MTRTVQRARLTPGLVGHVELGAKTPQEHPVALGPERRPGGAPCALACAEGVTERDHRLAAELAGLSHTDADYWTFRRGATRRQAHGLTQYPAMMVPLMQATLLRVVAGVDGNVCSVLDPFCGSGTTLVESMRLGLNYCGQDVNPLAVLYCRAKAGPFHLGRLVSAVDTALRRAEADRDIRVEADFHGLDKWFTHDIATALSRIRRAIRREPHPWCRTVLWVAMGETVRLSSNSRTSTFKLHIRAANDLATRKLDGLVIFRRVVSGIVARLQEEASILRDAGRLARSGCYRGEIQLRLGDSRESVPVHGLASHDVLITSPSYGDNTSTVPYGQYSYLPLQWIDLHDIDERADAGSLASTYEIDSRSLGGSRKHALRAIDDLLARAPSLSETLARLALAPVDRRSRVAAFCRDLDACLDPALQTLRPAAYLIWIVGNRQVGGNPVPTDAILSELLERRGVRSVARIQRRIPSKRMATRNNIASTMRGESILVFRKG